LVRLVEFVNRLILCVRPVRTSISVVVDQSNNRVLLFQSGLYFTTAGALKAYGQSNVFTTSSAATTPSGLRTPVGVISDNSGVYMSDQNNHRVVFIATGTSATRVYGQNNNMNTGSPNNGGTTSASGLSSPAGLALDAFGGLYGQCSPMLRHEPLGWCMVC
jgi:hypothetical protein